MAIKMPSQEQVNQAQASLEYQSQVDRYGQMIDAGQGTPVLWYNLGVAYLGLQNWKEAEDAFEHAIKDAPEMMEAFVNHGAACFQLGKYEHAVTSLKKALELKPDFLPAQANLGVALMRLGRHQESIESMEKVIKIEPNYPSALGALALCHQAMGNEEKAEEYKKTALEAGVKFSNNSSDK